MRRPLALAGVVAAAAVLYACGGDGGGTPTTVVTPTAIQVATNARYQVLVVDAVTLEPVTDALNLTFVSDATLTGPDGTALAGKTVRTTSGLFALDAAFTSTAPDFRVQVADAANNGWVPTGIRVLGDATLKGDQTVQIKMINTKKASAINALPAAVAMTVSSTAAGANGVLAAVTAPTVSKTVTTPEGNTATIGIASLAIPASTRGVGADGTPAAAGPVTVATTYFGNATADSLAAFPGGFAARVSVPAANTSVLNGASADASTFITGGFASFNVTDSTGKAIKQFDTPVTVGIDLPKGSLKADGTPVVVGDTYPVWSYNDSTGEWVFERNGAVQEKSPVDPNNFTVVFPTNHLSSWNLDIISGQSCNPRLNVAGRPAGDSRPLQIELVGSQGRRYYFTNTISDSALNLYNVPPVPLAVTVRDPSKSGTDKTVGTLPATNLCSGTRNFTVTVSLPVVATGTVLVQSHEACPDGTQQRALPVYLQLVTNGVPRPGYTTPANNTATQAQFSFATVAAGTSTLRVQNPRTGAWTSQSVSVSGNQTTTVTLPYQMTCTRTTGATGGF